MSELSLTLQIHGRLTPSLRRDRLLAAAHACAAAAQRWSRPQHPWRALTIHLLHDPLSARVNADILGHEGPTDVITQAYDPLPGEPPGLLGELYVNLDVAQRMSQRLQTTTFEEEVVLYIAHGCDHLCGSDDATPAQRAAMRRRDLRWMRSALAGL
ncbi:MAG: rRNA maturation RNase YbeY [Candidatus Spyradenecus sp.]